MLKIGQRNIKTAVAVLLTLMINLILYLISPEFASKWYSPFFAGIAAVYTMQRENSKSFALAKIRSFGSIFGGLFGMILILVYEAVLSSFILDTYGPIMNMVVLYVLTAIFIMVLISILVKFRQQELVFVAALTYLSVMISLRNNLPVVPFAINRISSTIIGVLITLLINNFHLMRFRNKDILFVSGLDQCLLTNEKRLTPFTTYTLTALLKDGLNFTISTTRTPASLSKILYGIPLNLELMIMNGAVSYDIKHERFLDVKHISKQAQAGVYQYFTNMNRNVFSYSIVDQALSIYHTIFENEAEEKFYLDRKNDYFRNHIKGKISHQEEVVFYILIDKKDIVETYAKDLLHLHQNDISCQIYPYAGIEGYYFLKIFASKTSKKIALDDFLSKHKEKIVISFGSMSFDIDVMRQSDYSIALMNADADVLEIADIIILSNNPDDLVKFMKHIYYARNPKQYIKKVIEQNNKLIQGKNN